MQHLNYLKNMFSLYLVSGAVLGVATFSLILAHKYNVSLNYSLEVMKDIKERKDQIRDRIAGIETQMRYLRKHLETDVIMHPPEHLFFQKLDDIKTVMTGASIHVARFGTTQGEKFLPVGILTPVKSYQMIVDYVGYLESLDVPSYQVRILSVSRDARGDVILNIQGNLRVPMIRTENRDEQ